MFKNLIAKALSNKVALAGGAIFGSVVVATVVTLLHPEDLSGLHAVEMDEAHLLPETPAVD